MGMGRWIQDGKCIHQGYLVPLRSQVMDINKPAETVLLNAAGHELGRTPQITVVQTRSVFCLACGKAFNLDEETPGEETKKEESSPEPLPENVVELKPNT